MGMFIDILAGILISLGLSFLLEIPLTPTWILLGAFFALLPDADFFIELAQRRTVGGKKLGAHRVLTHIPLLYIFPSAFLYFFFGLPLAILFTLCILWHFLHDSRGMGYGYRLLYPFSNRFYKFFSDKEGHYRYDLDHLVVSWTKEEVEALHEKYGNDHWIQDHVRYHKEKILSFFKRA